MGQVLIGFWSIHIHSNKRTIIMYFPLILWLRDKEELKIEETKSNIFFCLNIAINKFEKTYDWQYLIFFAISFKRYCHMHCSFFTS